MDVARRMWSLFEPLHAVTYFAPPARAAFEAAGLRGFWRGYFAGRAAPLGAVGAGPVCATFFGFAPSMVHRAVPDVWNRATPAAALTARLDGARAALAAALPAASESNLAEAAVLMRRAAESVGGSGFADRPVGSSGFDGGAASGSGFAGGAVGDSGFAGGAVGGSGFVDRAVGGSGSASEAGGGGGFGGRALAAANADLPWPDDSLGTLWQAATILREHRGDGHVAALLVAGLDGAGSLAWRASLDSSRDVLQPARGWTDEQWAAAQDRLTASGWLADGVATDAAHALRDDVERHTDTLAAGPWQALGPTATIRLADLLTPMSQAVSGLLPFPNPIVLPPPAA